MHRREFLRNALGLAAVTTAIAVIASPAEAARVLADPLQPDAADKPPEAEREHAIEQASVEPAETLDVGGRRGGRGRGRGWGRGRRRGWAWGRRRGWGRRRWWGFRRRRRWWYRRRRWWGRRRYFRRRWRRRVYYY